MSPRAPRRRFLAGMPAFLITACSTRSGLLSTPAPFPKPRRSRSSLLVLLFPGLGLSDLLVAAHEGTMPNAQHMIERGLLVEELRPRNGTVYTCQETIDELLSAWTPDEPLGYTTTMHLPITNSLSRATPPSPQNASPTLLGERLQALAEEVLWSPTSASRVTPWNELSHQPRPCARH